MAKDLSRKTATVYINHAPAQEALKSLQGSADKLTEKIRKGEAAGKSMVTEISKLNKVKNDMEALQKQIDSGLRPSFNQLQTLVAKTRAELRKMSQDDPMFKQRARELNAYSTEMNRLGNQIGTVKKEGGNLKSMIRDIGITAAATTLVTFFKSATDEAMEAEKGMAQFKNTLDNLGRNDVFDRLIGKADEMAAKFSFIDNDDVIGVFEKLITYGKLTENQIQALTPVIIDFAAKQRISLDESASVIIKALEGNGKALKEYGINIKDAKTDTERLGVVMDILGGKVRGAADAFAETSAGMQAGLQQDFKDFKEEIGNGLLPIINTYMERVIQAGTALKGLFSADKWKADLDDFGRALKTLSLSEIWRSFTKGAPKSTPYMGQKFPYLYPGQPGAPGTQIDLTGASRSGNQILGSGGTAEVEKVAKAHTKAASGAKNHGDEIAKLKKEYQDLTNRINDGLVANDPFMKAFKAANDTAQDDLKQLKNLYNKKIISLQEFNDTSVKIEEIRLKKLQELSKKYFDANSKGRAGESINNAGAPLAGGLPGIQRDFSKDAARATTDALAGAELDVMLAKGKKKLEAQQKQLDLQRAAELANTELTEKQKALIEEKYRVKSAELNQKHWGEFAQFILAGAQQIAGIVSAFNAGKDAEDEARKAKSQAVLDDEKAKLDRQLRGKILSQKEYDRQLKVLEDKKRKEDYEITKRAFERNKRMQIVQAIMGGAEAVVSTLAARPGFTDIISLGTFRAINIALAAATTAAQIATISAQKPPAYAKGGILPGPGHDAGGLPVINPHTGRKVAELEGGEPILSRRTYQNNRGIVDALLHASMYGNGQPIAPYWQNKAYRGINFNGISNTIRKYAQGGIFTTDGTGNVSTQMDTERMENLLSALLFKIDQPFKGYVLTTDVNAAQDIENKIKSDTTISRK